MRSVRAILNRHQPVAVKKTRGMFSLWTGTPMFSVNRGPLVVQTLAVCLARQAFNETHFITDARGAKLAELLGWEFTHVSTALEELDAQEMEHIWALGKIAALIEATKDGEPICQIDNDVLLFEPLPDRLLSEALVAQSPDHERFYWGGDMEKAFAISGLPRNSVKYNAGIIGGADVPLVRAYAYASLDQAQKFRGNRLNGTTTSMMVEQVSLGVFGKRCLVEVGTLFSMPPTKVRYPHYAHLVGPAKRDPVEVAQCMTMLRARFPEAAAKFEEGWKKAMALFPGCGGKCGCAESPQGKAGCGCHGSNLYGQ